jgi:aminomethyltransferase
VEGTQAFARLQATLTNDLRRVEPGRAQYTHLLAEDGSVTDDLIVWWVADERFDVMPNASNTSRVLAALGGVDVTADRAVVAVQGPLARQRLARVSAEAAAVGRFCVGRFEWSGAACLAAGTGYTGEDGVECAVPVEAAEGFFEAVLAAGVAPAGLGARDTLRLEAGLPLHGHELGPGITPLQAGLGWVVGWEKGDFCGRTALEKERDEGPLRRLRGILADGRQPPRHGDGVLIGGRPVGQVTSGNYSPMRRRGIALALVATADGLADGEDVTVSVRGRDLPGRLVPTRFWPDPDEVSS